MVKRKKHLLRGNKRQTFPRHVIFYDNESLQIDKPHEEIEHRLFLGIAQYVDYQSKGVEEEFVYENSSDFWNWAVSKTVNQRTLYLIAHNQDFDFRLTNGFSTLQRLGFHSHKQIIEYPRCIATFCTWEKVNGKLIPPNCSDINNPRKYITILDTLNWFKESLAQLGERVGTQKYAIPSYSAPMNEWIVYCRQDVIVLRKVFEEYIEFLKKYNLGTFAPTLAGQALNAFKTRFLRVPIEIHTHKQATEIERRGYFGGRTDCFFIGKLPFNLYYKLDINSMYPYCMHKYEYPTKLLGTTLCEFPYKVREFRQNYACIADVRVNTRWNCLPYRGKDKLLFPIGEYDTTLCSPELDLLDSMKIPYTYRQMAVYEKSKIFEQYISELYDLRRMFRDEQNEQYQYFTKLLMNSLYGKFGQRNETWEYLKNDGSRESGRFVEIQADTGEDITIKKVLGECFHLVGHEEGFDAFTAISAFVTSYSRVLLWELICKAGPNHVYYMDTDSLLVDKIGKQRLEKFIDANELGKLKIEAFDVTGEIHNVKDYAFANEVKIKGVSHKAEYLGDNKYRVEVWEHFNGAVQRNRVETVITKRVIKELSRKYEKGEVLPNGRTSPFVL